MGIADFDVDSAYYADHILIVSATEALLLRLTEILKKRMYECACANTLSKAAQLSRKRLYDLLILDCSAEDTDVPSLLAEVRGEQSLQHIPVLVLHSNPETVELQSDKLLKVIPYPIDPPELVVKVSTLLRLQKTAATSEDESSESTMAAQNAQLRELSNRFKRELREARSIQQALLPKRLPSDPRTAFAAAYLPLEAVGGDLYDIWKIRDNVYGLFIGDVTGHGLSAALIGAMSKMALSYAPKESPEETLMALNDGVADHMPEGKFITAAMAIYDADTGSIKVSRGGHPAPYIWRKKTGEVEEISPPGLPVGFVQGAAYRLGESVLEPGDRLLMMTDGITEAENLAEEMIGSEGVAKWFNKAAQKKTLRECLTTMLQLQTDYTGGATPGDDITLIGIQRVQG